MTSLILAAFAFTPGVLAAALVVILECRPLREVI